ncbi:OB-fold putative lipoprotein [Cupriavidus alkaliphilus]|uniref:OB-fold putative lipoprotein n=1 Tax=Cupriavidus alkaliphilus TaxID=942866 RepID=UPI001FC8FB12|nr:OB-fold putative lipoprotein [Cupriavidus alkaliphilus]
MSSISGVLDGTGDVLSGDFRMLADPKPASLGDIWADWKKNEITAKKKWDAQAILVSGTVSRITKVDGLSITDDTIAVYFKDSVNPQCTGKALMRDAMLVNQKKISNLQTGDKINVTGVLATSDSESYNSSNKECYFAFAKSKIEAAPPSAAAPSKAATSTKSKSTKTSKK